MNALKEQMDYIHPIRIVIGKVWSMIEEIEPEYPLFVELENIHDNEEDIIHDLLCKFFDDEDDEDNKPDYTIEDCVFIRDYDPITIKNLS